VRSGALEICINPWKGVYISTIKKMAPETDSAQKNKVAIGFRCHLLDPGDVHAFPGTVADFHAPLRNALAHLGQ
jgi:hypothetical protein